MPDRNAIFTALFLPMLYWTGAVVAITLFGYPGVVCMTPVAWVLAMPVGLRLARESASPAGMLLREAALAGGILGAWQGLLFAAVMGISPYLPGGYPGEMPSMVLVAVVAVVTSVPASAGLAAVSAWAANKRLEKLNQRRTEKDEKIM